MKKALIVYFSASGVTEGAAKITGADLYKIDPQMPYTHADMNWNDKQLMWKNG